MSVLERILRRDGTDAGVSTVAGITLTAMRRRDLGAVMEIEAVSYPKPWSRSVFEGEIAQIRSGTRHYVVARRPAGERRRDRIVGYAGLWFTPDDAHVTNVAVDPAQHRRGVATALMLALAQAAIDRGVASWTLEVRASSTGAQELYRTFGFAPAGVRTRYYENTEDAIVMWCSDIQSAGYRRTLDEIRHALSERSGS